MDFSEALQKIKGGKRMSNAHWPTGMFVVLQKGYPDGIPINQNTAEATGIEEGTVIRFRPYLMVYTVDGAFVPYVATQSDLLSEVWGEETPGCCCGQPRDWTVIHRTDGPCHLPN